MSYTLSFLSLSAPVLDFDVTIFIQTGLFLLMYVVVHILLVKPYLSARDQRESLTSGARVEGKKRELETEEIERVYRERKQLVLAELEAKRRSEAWQASEDAKGIMDETRQRVQSDIEQRRVEQRQAIESARSAAKNQLASISGDISKRLLS